MDKQTPFLIKVAYVFYGFKWLFYAELLEDK